MLSFQFSFAGENRDFNFSTPCTDSQDVAVVSVIGDVLIHDGIYRAIVDGKQDFSEIWRKVTPLFNKADFSIANLEGPAAMGIDSNGRDHGDVGFIYDKVVYSGTDFSFNYHPRILNDLKKSGIDLLTLANNHSLDRKAIGIDRTLQAANKINLPLVGVRSSQDRSGEFHQIVSVRDLNIAVIGCTEMTNGHADSAQQLLWCYKNATQIESTIRELKGRSDIHAIIVYPHWGQEYSASPDASQRTYARRFLEAGATAVIGSHPHVLQPWEKYVTRDGRETLIAYSLGNFVAYQRGIERKTGVVLYLGLSTEPNSKGKIVSALYTPTYRDGTEVLPVGDSSEAAGEARKHFGTKGRLANADSAHRKMCGQ
jgi:poly-gamma-glutamate synthesis protein (capsule biosynthesis protein)